MQLKFKQIYLHDSLDDIFNIDSQTFTRPFDIHTEQKDQLFTFYGKSDVWLIYNEEQELIGYYCLEEDKIDSIELTSLALLPQYQGQGHGRQVLDHIFLEHPNKKFWLVTHPQNTGAIICYLKSGFEIEAWKENYFGEGKHRLLLVRKP